MGGGYAEKALVYPAMSFPLPDGVSDGQALSLMVQGLTAWHLLRTSTHLQAGESVVVHAAAGGFQHEHDRESAKNLIFKLRQCRSIDEFLEIPQRIADGKQTESN